MAVQKGVLGEVSNRRFLRWRDRLATDETDFYQTEKGCSPCLQHTVHTFYQKTTFPASSPTRKVPGPHDESSTVVGAENPGLARLSSTNPVDRPDPSVELFLTTKSAASTLNIGVIKESNKLQSAYNETYLPCIKIAHLPAPPQTREMPETSDEFLTVVGAENPVLATRMMNPDGNPADQIAGAAAAVPPPTFAIDPFDKRKLKWMRWVERLETAFHIYGVADEQMRKNFLLHYMGSDTYDVICDKVAPDSPRARTYQQIVATLEEFFSPQPLEISENFRFKCRHQGDKDAASADETVDEYLVALRRIAGTCNFGAYLETALRLVFGIKRNDIRSRLLEKRDLTLGTARDIAVSMELSRKGGAEIEGGSIRQEVHAMHHPTGTREHRVSKNRDSTGNQYQSASDASCYRCGDKSHFANACKYKQSICSFCKLKGHLAKVCLKKSAATKFDSRSLNKPNAVETNYVDQSDEGQSTGSAEIREVCTVESSSRYKKFLLDVSVNGKYIRFEVDTGSPVSIISAENRNKLFPDAQLRKCDTELVSYCNTSIEVLGVLDARVKFKGKTTKLPLYVVNSGKHPLLGREWLQEMSVDWNSVIQGPSVINTIAATSFSCHDVAVKTLLEKYPKVFDASIGRIANVQANLPLKKNVQPVFLKARKIPFNMLKTVEDELEKLVAEGVLTKVNSSNWATPIVPVKKSQNRVRICGDYKQTVNPNIVVDKHPLPTVDELFASLAGGKKFSKIDLVQAYLQLEVAPEDREILTLSTHRGLYRPNRLMYGVASAPAIWQRQMEAILQGIEGVSVFLDDIKITGENDEVHLLRLEEVLRRLNEYGIRVNKDKCKFFVDEIEYCGYSIDKDGIHKIRKKVKAIQEMPRPKNRDEVRSFVGFVNYYGRFFQNLSMVLYPLNNLLKNDVPFRWTQQCEDSFRKVKEQMQSDNCLVHCSPELPLLLATDASPYGQNYMQVDKEAYAVIFGVKKFFQYIYGRKFVLLTDNQAISKIFGEHKGLPVMSALRMQHYGTYLQSFYYEIRFRKSVNHANADVMSRIPLEITDPENEIEESDAVELSQIDTLPLTAAELGQATDGDQSVQKLIQGIKHGQLVEVKDRFGLEQNEFSLQKGCLLRGIRVYVPAALRKRVLDELHSTHFGATRTKSLARGYCWWPGLDRDIEEIVANCTDCQSVRAEPAKMNLHCWEPPSKPFQRVHIDFAGPFMDTYFFVYVDAFSKWPEVQILNLASRPSW
ncbi:uncharacterized protein K02A2.6-like [Topomyia yanbarensis]|uniref:uncharacterized protein K02A2.6-like n=1 Tax=Topomyia yanbarensis TaxID=2498891 RepID=UPI00273C68C0|nr:uncharacterized protein K02A2.6-like [Topomyia yanbarensis]